MNPSLVLVQPRKTRPFITGRLLMGRRESNQTNKIPNNFIQLYAEMSTIANDSIMKHTKQNYFFNRNMKNVNYNSLPLFQILLATSSVYNKHTG